MEGHNIIVDTVFCMLLIHVKIIIWCVLTTEVLKYISYHTLAWELVNNTILLGSHFWGWHNVPKHKLFKGA